MHDVAIAWSTAVIEPGPAGPVLEVSFTVQPDLAWFNHFHYEVVLDERRRPRKLGKGYVRRDFSRLLQVGNLDTQAAADVGELRKRYDRLVAKTNKSEKAAWNRRNAAVDEKPQVAVDRAQSEAPVMGVAMVGAVAGGSEGQSLGRPPDTRPVSGVVMVELTRTELVSLKETIDVTPMFEGRAEAREAIQEVLHQRQTKPSSLRIEENVLEALAGRIIAIDVPTVALRAKLTRALQRQSVH